MTATAPPLRLVTDDIDRIYAAQQANRAAVAATTPAQRIAKIRALERAMHARREEMRAALWTDYRKPASEVDLSEIYPVVSEARHAVRHLRRWMKPRRVGTRLALIGSSSRIVYEPKGVVLIVAPWNFPINLTLGPLVSAVAAGNCAIVKPSELTPEATACSRRIVEDVFEENEVAVIEGGATVAETLLRKKFDHIFFTGSSAVGRIVMRAAAEHLTPVTLELGGKSPVFVDETADVADAAKKVAWGKFFNCGQACIAPDYALVHESVQAAFVAGLRSALGAMGAEGARGLLVDDRHAARVKRLLDTAVEQGAHVEVGGIARGREIEPTILTNVAPDAAVMREEIFGPVLPVVKYRTLDEALTFVAAREHPLVLYVFTRNRRTAREVVRRTRAGGTAINHTMIHFYETELPFGGVGESGVGKAHGRHGFETFSNARAVLEQRFPFSAIELLYPPYGAKWKDKLIDLVVRWL